MFVFVFLPFFLFFFQDLKEGVLTSVKDLNWSLRDGCHFFMWRFADRKHGAMKNSSND